MKVTFLGAGSFRTLPILRGVLAQSGILAAGEIALYDLNEARAETVGQLLLKTPEYAAVGCRVTWGQPVEDALAGADAVSIGFPCGSLATNLQSAAVSYKHGFMSSDQLSPTGTFLSLFGGPIVLDYAHMMERYCPNALFIIFANPVAVYSALVNNHTRIRALGICGGFSNCRWDLTRLMGKDALGDYDVDVAGINHLSFILRGTTQGKDLFKTLEPFIGRGWKAPRIGPRWQHQQQHIIHALRKLIDQYWKYGTMMFSTEGDGVAHLYYEEMLERMPPKSPLTPVQLRAAQQAAHEKRAQQDQEYRAFLAQKLNAAFWAEQTRKDGWLGRDTTHIIVQILHGLSGQGTRKIAASFPNRGAVAGFPERTVLEYSQWIDEQGLRPVPDLAVPPPFHGLLSALAMHQTLAADAIATEDPRLLFQALSAYPIHQNTRASRALYRDLLQVHRDEMSPAFQATAEYFNG